MRLFRSLAVVILVLLTLVAALSGNGSPAGAQESSDLGTPVAVVDGSPEVPADIETPAPTDATTEPVEARATNETRPTAEPTLALSLEPTQTPIADAQSVSASAVDQNWCAAGVCDMQVELSLIADPADFPVDLCLQWVGVNGVVPGPDLATPLCHGDRAPAQPGWGNTWNFSALGSTLPNPAPAGADLQLTVTTSLPQGCAIENAPLLSGGFNGGALSRSFQVVIACDSANAEPDICGGCTVTTTIVFQDTPRDGYPDKICGSWEGVNGVQAGAGLGSVCADRNEGNPRFYTLVHTVDATIPDPPAPDGDLQFVIAPALPDTCSIVTPDDTFLSNWLPSGAPQPELPVLCVDSDDYPGPCNGCRFVVTISLTAPEDLDLPSSICAGWVGVNGLVAGESMNAGCRIPTTVDGGYIFSAITFGSSIVPNPPPGDSAKLEYRISTELPATCELDGERPTLSFDGPFGVTQAFTMAIVCTEPVSESTPTNTATTVATTPSPAATSVAPDPTATERVGVVQLPNTGTGGSSGSAVWLWSLLLIVPVIVAARSIRQRSN